MVDMTLVEETETKQIQVRTGSCAEMVENKQIGVYLRVWTRRILIGPGLLRCCQLELVRIRPSIYLLVHSYSFCF